MEKSQVILSICLVTLLLTVLVGFLLFILFWQRNKSNQFIIERETMKSKFNEQLLKSQLEIQKQSFNTISMEIHDNVGQTLSLIKMQLNILGQKEILDKTLVFETTENITRAMTDLRDIAKSLNTERIELGSLSELAELELHRIDKTGIMNVKLCLNGEEKNISNEKKLIVFRIIQESFQNIIKHSEAKNVNVTLNYEKDHLNIEIQDDGKGFQFSSTAIKGSGLGLHNMINRAALIGGEAKIHSVINGGTVLSIFTPYV